MATGSNAVAPGCTFTPTMKDKIDSDVRDWRQIDSHIAVGCIVTTSEVGSVMAS